MGTLDKLAYVQYVGIKVNLKWGLDVYGFGHYFWKEIVEWDPKFLQIIPRVVYWYPALLPLSLLQWRLVPHLRDSLGRSWTTLMALKSRIVELNS